MTDINRLENELKEEFEMFSIAISRSDVVDKRKIFRTQLVMHGMGQTGQAVFTHCVFICVW